MNPCYKALSLLLHPDKIRNTCRGGSEEAFESVRKAMESLQDYLLLHDLYLSDVRNFQRMPVSSLYVSFADLLFRSLILYEIWLI